MGWEEVPTLNALMGWEGYLPWMGKGYLAWIGYATVGTPLAASRRRTSLLPPASKGWGKVMFSHLSVCVSVHMGGVPIFQLSGGGGGEVPTF